MCGIADTCYSGSYTLPDLYFLNGQWIETDISVDNIAWGFPDVTSGPDISQSNTGCRFEQLNVTLRVESRFEEETFQAPFNTLVKVEKVMKRKLVSIYHHCHGSSTALCTLCYFDTFMCETRKDSTGYPDALNTWAKKPVPIFRESLISDVEICVLAFYGDRGKQFSLTSCSSSSTPGLKSSPLLNGRSRSFLASSSSR